MSIKDELLLIELPCSVTMYEMKLQVSMDGRDRGLWFFLDDPTRNPPVREGVLIEWHNIPTLRDVMVEEVKSREETIVHVLGMLNSSVKNPDSFFNNLIQEAHEEEASTVNFNGPRSQIKWLLQNGFTIDDLVEQINKG